MLAFLEKIDEIQYHMRKQGLYYKISDICKLAASMPAPRFYVDAATANRQYNLYKAGRSRIHGIAKRKMYAEIFARYEKEVEILNASGQVVNKKRVMEQILNQPAPSFYYEDGSSLKMYYYFMANKRLVKK